LIKKITFASTTHCIEVVETIFNYDLERVNSSVAAKHTHTHTDTVESVQAAAYHERWWCII